MHAITNAKLGDDVLDEDPTIHELEKISCEITGKEAALFVPSGTMANLTAILAYCERGDCLLYTSPSPRDLSTSRMPSSA